MDEQERRLAENEALFREVNERTEQQAASFGGADHPYEFLCECANPDCSYRIEATLGDYERVRSNPRRFMVRPDHALPEVESVVERHEAYWVIEKQDDAAVFAERRDPRRGA